MFSESKTNKIGNCSLVNRTHAHMHTLQNHLSFGDNVFPFIVSGRPEKLIKISSFFLFSAKPKNKKFKSNRNVFVHSVLFVHLSRHTREKKKMNQMNNNKQHKK